METIEKRIDEIFSSVLEAVNHSEKVETSVIAKILVAQEKMFSIMATRGRLNDFDSKLLTAVREKMKVFQIEGVIISEIKHTENSTYTDSDSYSSGPCTSYYIQVKKIVAHKCHFEHKKGTWYEVCTICAEERFIGLGDLPGSMKVCHSKRQKECIEDTGMAGKMDPDTCYGCPEFY